MLIRGESGGDRQGAQRAQQRGAGAGRQAVREVEHDEQDRGGADEGDRDRRAAVEQRRQHELDQDEVGDADAEQGGQAAPARDPDEQDGEEERQHTQRDVADEVVEVERWLIRRGVHRAAGDPDFVTDMEGDGAAAVGDRDGVVRIHAVLDHHHRAAARPRVGGLTGTGRDLRADAGAGLVGGGQHLARFVDRGTAAVGGVLQRHRTGLVRRPEHDQAAGCRYRERDQRHDEPPSDVPPRSPGRFRAVGMPDAHSRSV